MDDGGVRAVSQRPFPVTYSALSRACTSFLRPGLWRLLGYALTRIEADSATAQATEDGDCALTGPRPELGIGGWLCLEHKEQALPKDGHWYCPPFGGRREDASAKQAEAAIVLDLDPATLTSGQGVAVTYFDDTYIGRVEVDASGTVRIYDELVGYLKVWSPADGRTLGVTGLRDVAADEVRFLAPARRYVD